MNDVIQLIDKVNELGIADPHVIFREESWRITISGISYNPVINNLVVEILSEAGKFGLEPQFLINDTIVVDILESRETIDQFDDCPWRLVIAKKALAEQFRTNQDENLYLFFSEESFSNWLSAIDPFNPYSSQDPKFIGYTTFYIQGLAVPFGGPKLRVFSTISTNVLDLPNDSHFPCSDEIKSILHINTTNPINLSPDAIVLTWGDLTQLSARKLVSISSCVLAASFAQEINNCCDIGYGVVIKGTKRICLQLTNINSDVSNEFYDTLKSAVSWIYQERAETRHRLVMDRLSIDIVDRSYLIHGLIKHLHAAVDQAKDSYAFVILERKDAYYKEIRDVMKDMRNQADLYAAKTRDLIASLSRDLLGAFVFIGFSFVSKFDRNNLSGLLESRELSLLLKFLSLYYIISMLFQVIVHLRDSVLSFHETLNWIDILKGYTSSEDIENKFNKPILKRRNTFICWVIAVGVIYIIMSIFVWNLPKIAKKALNTASVPTFEILKEQDLNRGASKPAHVNTPLTAPK